MKYHFSFDHMSLHNTKFAGQSSANKLEICVRPGFRCFEFTCTKIEITGMKIVWHYCFPACTRISFRKCKSFVDLWEWISTAEDCTFDKHGFFISLGVREMSGSSVPGSGQAVSAQLDCLRSHKYIWLCWLPDAIKAAKALERWCLRDPRLHWSEMRPRLRRATLSSPPCIYKWRGGHNECQPNLCLLH